MQTSALNKFWRWLPWVGLCACLIYGANPAWFQPPHAQGQDKQEDREKGPLPSSYDQVSPVLLGQQSFEKMFAADKANKEAVMARQRKLLEERYDLSVRVDDK